MASLRRPLAMALAISAVSLGAADADDEYGTGMQRVKTCSLQASARKLTGDARQSFVSGCVSGTSTSGSGTSTGNAQQDKVRSCTLQATNRHLAGDARTSFVSDCLNGQ